MASPAAIRRRTHSGSFSEHSRILQPTIDGSAAVTTSAVDAHGLPAHGKMNYKEAVFNAINVLLGVGVLSSPFALRSSGLLVGIPLFFFFTLVTNHTGKLLGYCLDYQEGMTVRVARACVLTRTFSPARRTHSSDRLIAWTTDVPRHWRSGIRHARTPHYQHHLLLRALHSVRHVQRPQYVFAMVGRVEVTITH